MASNQSDIPPPPPSGEARAPGARGTARLAAVQALYQMDLAQTDAEAVIGQFTVHRFGHEVDGAFYDQADEPLFRDLVLGVVRAQLTVDPLIASHLAKGWKLARIDAIIRAILRAGTYELKERPDIPVRVIINEYVDVAHAFFGGDEPGLVNAVLDAIGRDVRAGDFSSPARG